MDPWFGVDKLKHLVACAVIAGDVYWLALANGASPLNRALLGFGSAVLVGAGKELLWDLVLKRGDPSWRDFTADVAGAVIGTGIAAFLDRVSG